MPLEALDNEREHGSSLVLVAAVRLNALAFNMRLSGTGAYPALAVFGQAWDRLGRA
jgi:hypothetical protein